MDQSSRNCSEDVYARAGCAFASENLEEVRRRIAERRAAASTRLRNGGHLWREMGRARWRCSSARGRCSRERVVAAK
eukprot:9879925-Lingulodinium_polyedra.AAC.1